MGQRIMTVCNLGRKKDSSNNIFCSILEKKLNDFGNWIVRVLSIKPWRVNSNLYPWNYIWMGEKVKYETIDRAQG